MADNKPTHRIIAKLTDSRNDRYHDVGVAWRKVDDEGREIVSLRFNPFVASQALVGAVSVMLVPWERDGQKSGGGRRSAYGDAPPDDDAPPPDDSDFGGEPVGRRAR